jgi:hypothetical protein
MASEAAAVTAMAAQAAAIVAQALGTKMKIEESIADYQAEIERIKARSAETEAEAERKIANTRAEGVLTLKEAGAQAAYEARMAMTRAEMTALSEEARLGAGGTRLRGSPLLAAQQNVNLAFAAADRTIESGTAGMNIGGLRLGHAMQDIQAQATLVTKEYGRQITEAKKKQHYLEENKAAMIAIAAAGGLPALATTFYNYGSDLGWFK